MTKHSSSLVRCTHTRKAGRKIGLCGQAPSNHPDFARYIGAHRARDQRVQPLRQRAFRLFGKPLVCNGGAPIGKEYLEDRCAGAKSQGVPTASGHGNFSGVSLAECATMFILLARQGELS